MSALDTGNWSVMISTKSEPALSRSTRLDGGDAIVLPVFILLDLGLADANEAGRGHARGDSGSRVREP